MMTEFTEYYRDLCKQMLVAPVVHVDTWQALDVSQSSAHATHEIMDHLFVMETIPDTIVELQELVQPDLPWAEEHFSERVGGIPLNPPPSHVRWPWGKHNALHQDGDQGPFSHSYPERMWPIYTAGYDITGLQGDFITEGGKTYRSYRGEPIGQPIDFNQLPKVQRRGIRFRYGDLNDLVNHLVKHPLSRQGYLPIWFPEDTGAHADQRVPCTLGYHFMMRYGKLSCRYYMRSCDLVRHFANDVYFACRLTQWLAARINRRLGLDQPPIFPGELRMYISSLHSFLADEWRLKKEVGQ